MPAYITLIRWTDKGRENVSSLPDRADQVAKRVEQAGGKLLGNYVTMGRFDQVSIVDAPDEETVAKLALVIAGRGNATTETLRAFTMEEVRDLV
ncbi:MAG: GYD domain-containing protein [Actinomycetota bacterium]|nr:GYD domain-containing protein [Actinomycetota bacterium]